jgi:hypothetical protein
VAADAIRSDVVYVVVDKVTASARVAASSQIKTLRVEYKSSGGTRTEGNKAS